MVEMEKGSPENIKKWLKALASTQSDLSFDGSMSALTLKYILKLERRKKE